MIYRLRHVTTYAYAHSVDLAAHLLLLTPRSLPYQNVVRSTLAITPTPSHMTEAADHFGNAATRVFLDLPHERFEVIAEALVALVIAAPDQAIAAASLPPRLDALGERIGALSDAVSRRYFALLPATQTVGMEGAGRVMRGAA